MTPWGVRAAASSKGTIEARKLSSFAGHSPVENLLGAEEQLAFTTLQSWIAQAGRVSSVQQAS
jgi:hypothetical protein